MFLILIIILVLNANLVKSQATNVTCLDGRICFVFTSFEEHCEILVGDNCHPPCDNLDCKTKVENNVLCDHYFCTPLPPPPKPSLNSFMNMLEGAIGSFISSFICFLLYTIYKRRQARRQRIREILNEEDANANISGQENEGDSDSRPIIRPPSEPRQISSPTSPQIPTSTSTLNPFSPINRRFDLSPIPEQPSSSSPAILTPTDGATALTPTVSQMKRFQDIEKQLSPSTSPINRPKKKVNHLLKNSSINGLVKKNF